MEKQNLILIDGPIGSGKSTVAKLLHLKLKRTALLSLDRIKWLVSDYRPVHKDLQLASNIGKVMAKEYLRNNISVIVEKAFTRKEFLDEFARIGKNKKVKLFIYQIQAPLSVAIKRVAKRPIPKDGRGKPLSRARVVRNHKHYELYRYKKATVFDSVALSPETITRRILRDVRR